MQRQTVGRVERSSKLFVVTGLTGKGEGLENILNSQNLLDFRLNIFLCTHCVAKFSNSIEPNRSLNKAKQTLKNVLKT